MVFPEFDNAHIAGIPDKHWIQRFPGNKNHGADTEQRTGVSILCVCRADNVGEGDDQRRSNRKLRVFRVHGTEDGDPGRRSDKNRHVCLPELHGADEPALSGQRNELRAIYDLRVYESDVSEDRRRGQ